MPKCFLNIKKDPVYRREAFEAGVKAHGYKVIDRPEFGENDLFVTWNLHGHNETLAANARKAGAKVIVAENGAIGKDKNGIQLYSMARDAHHAGRWFVDQSDRSRWDALGIPVLPWQNREDGHVLICGQRGIGSRLMASPPAFERNTEQELKRAGFKNVRIRFHPGRTPSKAPTPLEDDLKGARVCAIWSSMSGVKALTQGIPVAYFAPAWVGSWGATQGVAGVEFPRADDELRMKALIAVSWYQWTVDEITRGVPFDHLLRLA